jgi:hypothetical protein
LIAQIEEALDQSDLTPVLEDALAAARGAASPSRDKKRRPRTR